MAKREFVKTNFYANGKCVLVAEWYEALNADELNKRIKYAAECGYGKVDTATDTTGRMIKFD